jgi:hypothetical protein
MVNGEKKYLEHENFVGSGQFKHSPSYSSVFMYLLRLNSPELLAQPFPNFSQSYAFKP